MDTDMGTELDGRLLAMRQALAIAIALSTRSNPRPPTWRWNCWAT